MSDQPSNPFDIPKPTDLNIPIDQIKEKAQQAYNEAPPEVKQAVKKSQTFYQENKTAIRTIAVGFVALKIYKRRVSRAAAKAVVEQLAKDPQVNLPTMFDILDQLKSTPGMAYIPHGDGMVHLLGPSKDVIVTVFGDFKNMGTDEIFRYAGKALGIRGY